MTEKQSSKTVSIRTKGDTEELFKSIGKDFSAKMKLLEAYYLLISVKARKTI